MKQKLKKGELFLEIGTEEVPSSHLDYLKTFFKLETFVKALLTTDGAFWEETQVKSYQTPRRIVIDIQGLRDSLQKEEIIQGPKKEICYTPDGTPTRTLEGFLKSNKATLKELTEESGRLVIRRTKKRMTRRYLAEELSRLLSMGFPKTMRWDESGLTFPRPIRWLLCVYDGKIIPFKRGNLKAGGKTYGISPKRTQKIVKDWKSYSTFLKREKILLERCASGEEGERKRFIRERLKEQLQKLGGFSESMNEALLNEVTNLVEKPVVFSGHFDKKFLKLPKEILVASMSKYQRLFSVENRKGELLPCFVACANGSPSLGKVRKNYEHVLNARLEDAIFFYESDTKESFSKKRDSLKLLVYHQRLGTMYDKSERMKKLASLFAQALQLNEGHLTRACELAKNDLVAEMVKEFPSLQGIVGYYYAKKSGEPEEVALALREQYLPKGDVLQEFLPIENRSREKLPESSLGAALSFLEKLDHVVGCFYAGESPTGSSDPYGLRRAANALFKIILDQKWKFSLEEMVQANATLLDHVLTAQKDGGKRAAIFLQERLKGIFKEEGFREDLIEAVVTDINKPVEMHEKLSVLKKMMETRPDDFLAAFKVVERTHNILKPIQPQERERIGEVKEDLFQEELEKSLWKIYNDEKHPIQKLIEQSAWTEASAQYGRAFSATLHQFFEKVLVNVEDQEVRRNRLAMMKEINELYTKSIADLSKLMISPEPKMR